MSKSNTNPIWEMKAGKCKISAWKHPVDKPNEPARFSFSLQRSYQKDGKWINDTITLYPEDLSNLEDIIQATRQRAFVKYTETTSR